MNRNILLGLAAAIMLIASLCVVRRGDALRKEVSPTRHVIVDGKAFVSDESSPDGTSLLKKELGKRGVRLPEGFELTEMSIPSHPVIQGRLKDSPGARPVDTPQLPSGLTADHTLRMEGDGKPVDLVFGTMDSRGSSIRFRLLSSGWETVSTFDPPRLVQVLQFTRGKETNIVCLDEAEGAFLLFREVDR